MHPLDILENKVSLLVKQSNTLREEKNTLSGKLSAQLQREKALEEKIRELKTELMAQTLNQSVSIDTGEKGSKELKHYLDQVIRTIELAIAQL